MRRALPLVLVLAAACTEPSPPATTGAALVLPATAPAERIPLAPLTLATQADYDALEDRWLARRDPTELVAALRALADAQPKPEPLLLQRIAVLVVDDMTADGRGLQPALDASARLRDLAPEAAHTLWLNGWVLWQILGRNGPIQVTQESRSLIDALVQQWERLLQLEPGYVGPRKHGAAEVKVALERLKRALAESTATPPAETAGPARQLGPAELEALSALERFRGASDGNRRGVCRDWREREPTTPRSAPELRMDLACATLTGDANVALAAIQALVASDGAAFDACVALALVAERSDARALAAARAAHPVACP